MNISNRLRRLRQKVIKKGLDGLVITKLPNVRYMSGFTGSEALILLTRDRFIFLTDFRYIEQAQGECKDLEIVERKRSPMKALGNLVKKQGLKVLGFESEALSFAQYAELKGLARKVIPVKGMVEEMREVKEEEEINRLKGAIKIAEEAFKKVLKGIRPGLTDKQIANRLEFDMKEAGAEGAAFNTICVVGERASQPHALPSGVAVRPGNSLLIDWGARWRLYNSDLTRVVFLNRITSQAKKIYRIVKKAQGLAIEKIREGVSAREVDLAARNYIESQGYGKNFGHGLGHGIGLEVHESPRLYKTNRRLLKAGMVVTVEPGIYVPQQGGVRIEDVVLVKRDGYEVLSHTPKALEAVLL
ncbi:MAG TPA: M24 family metallopeptidase [Candidatus Tripitaka californicus]|uniref:M24 family metallopeptidase n=2 Tax=Candidatus Tripitaka californicus TaxID=3367616 RepID=UPI0040282EF9|nr:aminopeptidase P family protein [Planctomycetota bacterium]